MSRRTTQPPGIEAVYPALPRQVGMLRSGAEPPESPAWCGRRWLDVDDGLDGDLDLERLTAAWRQVAAAHPASRAALVWKRQERPLLVIHAAPPLEVAEGEGGDAAEGCDPSRPPAVNLSAGSRPGGGFRLTATYHAALMDAAGADLLLRRTAERYAAPDSEMPPDRFRDYVAWVKGRDGDAAREVLGDALAGAPEPADPWVDLAQTAEAGYQRSRPVDAATAAAVSSAAELLGLAPETPWLAAWAWAAGRFGAGHRAVTGLAVSGRAAAGLDGALAAPCDDRLPLRLPAPPEANATDGEAGTVARWLAELEELRAAATGNAHLSADELAAAAGLPGRPHFAFVPPAAATPTGHAAGGRPAPALAPTVELALAPAPEDSAYGLELRLRVAPGGPDEALADALLDLVVAAAGALADGRRPPFLPPAQEARFAAWNDTATAFPRRSIPELFSAVAHREPAALAVEAERSLTYGELAAEAARLAHHLISLGVAPGDAVAVSMERSADLYVTLLAILQAGAFYVPVDVDLPADRRDFMLRDSGARLRVVCGGGEAEGGDGGPPVLDLAASRDAVAARPAEPPPVAVPSGAAAYAIYTSGSTGRPKGVLVPHHGVVRLVRDTDYVRLGPGDRVAQAANASFDAATFEIWGPLLNGGVVVRVDTGTAIDPAAMPAFLEGQRIGVLFLTTALFNGIAREAPTAFAGLNHLLFGGEAVDPRWVRRVLDEGSPGRLLHVYGPTETTTYASWYPVAEVAPEASTVPIGRPLANTGIHVVDGELRPVPAGVTGELVISGPGLAVGYLGRPALTAERFIPDPFAAGAGGGRLYRTGDRVCRRDDGDLVFLGRQDHQVKLRGFRIELGEVETALMALPGVGDAVVVVREDEPGDRRLVAYVTGRDGGHPEGAAVRAGLASHLPDYMVPSAVVVLDALPLNANGKVERSALPVPPREGTGGGWGGDEAPRGPYEPLIAGIWEDVLQVEGLGRHDGFFDLGGHSLLATRIVSRVRQALGVEVPLRSLFEAPTVAEFARRVEHAADEDRGLDTPPLVAVERDGDLPLSFAQQRLWFLHQLEPDSPAYNMPIAFEVEGRLDTAAFAAALSEVVRRHEALRTGFRNRRGRPVQMVEEPRRLDLPVADLSGLGGADGRRQVRRLAGAAARRAFDLAAPPLLRVTLLRLGEGRHGVLFCLHHIVGDGWSMGVLIDEVTRLYRAFAAGLPSPLAELPLQYADYAAWQRSWLTGDTLEAEIGYWRQRLEGVPPLLELPTDRPRPAEQRYRGAGVTLELSRDLGDGVRALARRAGASDFMVLLAAFQLLLGRWSRQAAVSVGSPIAGRTRLEVERLIGFFVNSLVLTADLDGHATFEGFLETVRDDVLEAYLHQHLPFERLVEELAPQRSLSHSPLFQVLFALQNAPRPELALPGAELRSLGAGAGTAQFDLSLDVGQPDGRFSLALTYDTDLFDATTARRLLASFRTLLAAAVNRPGERPEALPLLDASEAQQVVHEWQGESRPAFLAGSWLNAFARRAAATPDVVAAVCAGETFTYGELDAVSSRAARRLAALGVGPDTVVPLLAERGLELLASMVAVLRAGGAYLPLDPRHPAARLGRVLAGVDTPVVVCAGGDLRRPLNEALAELAIDGRRRPRVVAPADLLAKTAPAELAAEREPRRPGPDHLAYVIFTSGSTGTPKGPMIDHRGFLNHIRVLVDELGLTAADRVAQNASQCFDISVWQFLGPLIFGGRVVILPDAVAHDGARLLAAVGEEKITVLEVVPALMRAMLDGAAGDPASAEILGRLRWLIPTGEELPPELARRWLKAVPGVPLLNAYGPAECSDDVSWARIDRFGADGTAPRVTLGRPVPNVRLHVLDPWLAPVPVGVPGELCIGGPAVGRGYLGDPRRTAAAFVPDPLAAAPGRRLYLSGDLARHLPNGELDFLGRVDHQVKVRGLRIEPGEVEAALGAHPDLAEVVVVARDDGRGERVLVGYAAPAEGRPQPVAADLRDFLRRDLPDYMVPSAFVVLDELPRNTNGKLDRKALPAPRPGAQGGGGTAGDRRVEPPRTLVEELVAGVWAEVLEVPEVGRGDNFFDLGGHSLLATQVLSRIGDALDVVVPLRRLFEAPTVARLAEAVELVLKESRGLALPSLERRPEGAGAPPLSLAQERLWFLQRMEPESTAYNMPLAYRFEGELAVPALEGALSELTRRHEVLRTTYEERDEGPVQVVGEPRPPVAPLVDLSGLTPADAGVEARHLARAGAALPFDLERGPVLRARLIRLAAEDHLVSLEVHHVACDGWSLDVLARETTVLYGALSEGRPSPLAPLPVQYADFALWQRGWLEGEVLEEQLAWWRRRLGGDLPVLALPTDRPRPAQQSYRGGVVTHAVPATVVRALRHLGRQEESTLYLVLLAGWAALLSRWSGQEELVLGTDVAGRDRLETEGLIGFFVGTVALRLDLAGDPTFRRLLRGVRGEALEAFAHQDVPFHRVVEAVEPRRDPSRNPLFQVSLVMQNTPAGEVEMDRVAARPVEPEQSTSAFDVSLAAQERADGTLSLVARYASDLFDPETIAGALSDLEDLLATVAGDPETRLASLELASRRQRREAARQRRGGGLGLRSRRTAGVGAGDGNREES